MSFPWLQSLWEYITNQLPMEEDEFEMGDLLLLCIKEFEGKLRSSEGQRTTTGDLATLTATSGKDMYKAKAKVIFTGGTGVTTYSGTVKLTLNAVAKEVAIFVNVSGTTTTSAMQTFEYEFEFVGKVASTQVMKLDVTAISNATVEGFLEVFEETTGATPRPAAQTQGTATIVGGIAGSLGYMAKKVFQGKDRSAEGSRTTTGDLATLTANTGKDMYLAKAKINMINSGNATYPSVTVEIKANAVIKETATLGAEAFATASTYLGGGVYEFVWIGKVASTQVIKLEVTAISSGTTIEGVIEVFEETTGADPTA